jgi:hypothetical protein
MDLKVENLVRSAALVVLGLPIVLPISGAISANTRVSPGQRAVQEFKDDLALPCLKYVFAKSDTKAEREAKNQIDEVLGGDTNYGSVCKYVL